jgi:hypothetical protein
MGDSSRSVTSIGGPCEYITPIGVRVPHNPLLMVKGINTGYLIIFESVGNKLLRLFTGLTKVKM